MLYAVSSVLVATRLACDMYSIRVIRNYADLPFSYSGLRPFVTFGSFVFGGCNQIFFLLSS